MIETEENNPLIVKKNNITKELNFLKQQIEFVDELTLSYPDSYYSIKKYREEIDYTIASLEVKIKTINKIIKINNRPIS